MSKTRISWAAQVQTEDTQAAESYLNLLFSAKRAEALKTKLREAEVTEFAAKDVLRASGLKLLDERDELVANQVKKIKAGKELSAILLVRLEDQGRLIVPMAFTGCVP